MEQVGQYSTAISSPPGRVISYMGNPDKLDPVSCRLIWFNPDKPEDFFYRVMMYLSRGAGVKIILDNYVHPIPTEGTISLKLAETHQDYPLFKEDITPASSVVTPDIYIQVEDSLDDIAKVVGIIYNHLQQGKHVEVNLSKLRPLGTTNQYGLVASGPASFGKVYQSVYTYLSNPTLNGFLTLLGLINETVKRGGIYPNGITTTEMIDTHPLLEEYLSVPKVSLPGSHSKGVTLTKEPSGDLLSTITDLRNRESLFLSKLHADTTLRPNVCMGLFLPDGGTCLIWRVNLGAAKTPEDIVDGFMEATKSLVNLHLTWNRKSIDPPIEQDRQVGLCVMGLSNLLANNNIKYIEFIDALALFLNGKLNPESNCYKWIQAIADGYKVSTYVADYITDQHHAPPLLRLHTVEPGQSHPYRCKDIKGVTVARGLYPPLTNRVIRRSDTMSGLYTYPGHETIRDDLTKWDIYDIHSLWFRLMEMFGKPHAISYDTYHNQTEDDIIKWYRGNLPTCYYHKGGDLISAQQTTKVDFGVCSIDKPEGCPVCGGD